MNQEQVNTLQAQIDSGELDVRQMDEDQQSALQELIRRGVIKGPAGGVSAIAADRDAGERGIIQQGREASQVSGLQTPFGEIMSERASFELVGDVIGSFAPYLTNRKELVKDIIKGKGAEKYTKPTGKDAFKANAFSNITTKFKESLENLSRQIGGETPAVGGTGKDSKTIEIGKKVFRGTRPGRALAGTIGFLEKAAKAGVKLARGEIGAIQSGDATKSLLRTGARTEAKSLIFGAVGAGTGSAVFELTKFKQGLSSNLSMDLGELTTDEIDDLPFAGRLGMHSAIAMKNSLMFGAIGSGIGMAASKGFGAAKKSLLGLNSDASMELARKSFEKGVPLSPTALAGEGIGGFLSRNFFVLFGVTPLIGGKGAEKLREQVSQVLFPSLLKASSGLQPNRSAMGIFGQGAIGAEGIARIADNYEKSQGITDVLFTNLLIKNDALGSPSFIPTDNLKKTLDQIGNERLGTNSSQFRALMEGRLDTKNMSKELKDQINSMLPVASANQLLTKDTINLFEAAQYRRLLTGIQMETITKGEKGRQAAKDINDILTAMDNDMALAGEIATKTDIPTGAELQNFINLQKGATPDERLNNAVVKIKELSTEIKKANQTYFQLVNGFDEKYLAKGNKFQLDQLLGAALFNAGRGINTQDVFTNMFQATLNQKNPQAMRELKGLLGIGKKDAKGEYADAFLKKLGMRHVFDSFNNAFRMKGVPDGFSPVMTLNENVNKAETVVRQILEDKPELAQYFKAYDDNTTLVDTELMRLLNKTDGSGKPIFDASDKAKIEEALQTGLEEINLANKSIDNFSVVKFRENLGIDDPNGRAMLEELYGKAHVKDMTELVDIITAGVNIGLTDPSTFVTRRIVLSGTATAGIGASLGFFGSGGGYTEGAAGGFLAPFLSALAARRYGSWIADPNTTKAALGLFSEREKKFLLRGFGKDGPVQEGIYTRGIGVSTPVKPGEKRALGVRDGPVFGTGPFGLIDPTEPLGKYFGPTRARNLAILMNYFTFPTAGSDKPTFTAQNITMKDINDYFEQVEDKVIVPNPQVSLGQLPDSTIAQMFPEYAAFKKLSIEDKKIFNDALKAKLAAQQKSDAEEDELNQIPDAPQAAAPNVPPANVAQTPPAPVPEATQTAQNLNLNIGQNYANLFPQDELGQAIAQRKQV